MVIMLLFFLEEYIYNMVIIMSHWLFYVHVGTSILDTWTCNDANQIARFTARWQTTKLNGELHAKANLGQECS